MLLLFFNCETGRIVVILKLNYGYYYLGEGRSCVPKPWGTCGSQRTTHGLSFYLADPGFELVSLGLRASAFIH